MGGLGLTEVLLVGGIALLFFGPSRLPSLGQALGKTISNFKKGMQEIENEEPKPRLISETEASHASSRSEG